MKKIKSNLAIAIIILVIVIINAIYILGKANKDINNTALGFIILGLIIFAIIFSIVIIKIYNKKELRPEKALLIIMPIFCILLSIAMPVGRGHDEFVHWLKAFEISEGTLITPIRDGNAVAELPSGVNNIIVQRGISTFKYIDNLELLNEKLNYDEKVFNNIQNSAAYCFVQYTPEVIGILVGKLITQIPIIIAYIARFANMIFCIVIMYFAIKLIPFGKNLLLVFSIIPIAIEGFATMSPDGLTIAICALFIAYTLYIAFDKNKKCGTKETVILTVIGAIVSLCKVVYMPLIFLCLIIPKEKFKNKRERIISISIILGVGIILNLIWFVFGSSILLNSNTNTYIDSNESGTMVKLTALLSNPFLYVCKVFYTFFTRGNQYFLSLFGGQLEWSETIRIEIIPYITCAIAIIASLSDEKLKESFKKYQKVIIGLIILVITLLIFTSLYIQWSDNELAYIDGVQGRYFLPILPLILMLVANIKLKSHYTNTDVTKLICISGLIIQIYTITNIMAIHI